MSINKISEFKLFPKKIRDKLRYELNWRFFIQYRFDKFFSYKKYKIQNSSIKKHIIQNNEGYYKKFNSLIILTTFQKKLKLTQYPKSFRFLLSSFERFRCLLYNILLSYIHLRLLR